MRLLFFQLLLVLFLAGCATQHGIETLEETSMYTFDGSNATILEQNATTVKLEFWSEKPGYGETRLPISQATHHEAVIKEKGGSKRIVIDDIYDATNDEFVLRAPDTPIVKRSYTCGDVPTPPWIEYNGSVIIRLVMKNKGCRAYAATVEQEAGFPPELRVKLTSKQDSCAQPIDCPYTDDIEIIIPPNGPVGTVIVESELGTHTLELVAYPCNDDQSCPAHMHCSPPIRGNGICIFDTGTELDESAYQEYLQYTDKEESKPD